MLRFWEAKFAQLKPMKRGGGRRYYRPEDVALLRGIRFLLYDDGYTIRGVQKILREQGPRFVMEQRPPVEGDDEKRWRPPSSGRFPMSPPKPRKAAASVRPPGVSREGEPKLDRDALVRAAGRARGLPPHPDLGTRASFQRHAQILPRPPNGLFRSLERVYPSATSMNVGA